MFLYVVGTEIGYSKSLVFESFPSTMWVGFFQVGVHSNASSLARKLRPNFRDRIVKNSMGFGGRIVKQSYRCLNT